MESVLGVSWSSWGAGGLIALIVLLVLTGQITTPRMLRNERHDRDEAVAQARADAKAWRDAYMSLLKSQDVSTHYIGQLAQVGTTMNKLLEALPAPSLSGEDGLDAPSRK